MVEGVRREAQSRDGGWVDEVLMGILEHEWRARATGSVSSTAR